MDSKQTHEPFIYFIGKICVFILGITSILIIAILGGCKLKGVCRFPIELYVIFCVMQWISVSIIIDHSLLIARIMLLASGCALFIYSILLTLNGSFMFNQAVIAILYSLIFGVLFSIYVFCSKKLHNYITRTMA